MHPYCEADAGSPITLKLDKESHYVKSSQNKLSVYAIALINR
jgi:hypothetical protein